MAQSIIFITGGCRSGKSRFAFDHANRGYSDKIFLATSEILDDEMALRVENHKRVRGPEWRTIEEPVEIVDAIGQSGKEGSLILLDCITLWISNLLIRWDDDPRILDEVSRLIKSLQESPASFLIVSNEVGMGIVPVEPLGRRFRDLAGAANQKIAHAADTVVFMVSGIPIFLKGEK
jgi:adenosylcobinamide kinase / adenosylcobinamide-phosphate guanylyltransferase